MDLEVGVAMAVGGTGDLDDGVPGGAVSGRKGRGCTYLEKPCTCSVAPAREPVKTCFFEAGEQRHCAWYWRHRAETAEMRWLTRERAAARSGGGS
jgi:hypothetical protein